MSGYRPDFDHGVETGWPYPNDDGPEQCRCGGWFNPRLYTECARCRDAYVQAVKTVRAVFPHARIIGTANIPTDLGRRSRPEGEHA